MSARVATLLAALPGDAAIVHPAMAIAVIAITYLIARSVARVAAPRISHALRQPATTMTGHLRRAIHFGIASLLLAGAVALWPQGDVAHLILGAALGLSVAMFAVQLLHAAAMPRWAVMLVALLLFGLVLSSSNGGVVPVRHMLDSIGIDLGKRRITLLGIVTITITSIALFAAVRLANRVVSRSIALADGFDATQKLLAQKLAAIAIVIAAFFIGIDMLGIDLTAFAVFSGALGLAAGFGLQKTFGNLIAGIILLMDRSIKPGDVIVVGDSFGWVNKIGVRAVSVITRDGKEHLIPNENLMTQEVENWSYSDRNVRIRIPVGVGYDADLDLAQRLMLEAAGESPRVLQSPPPNVWMTGFGESRVEFDILVWINDPESGVGNVRSDVLGRLWRLFRANGVAIPYPQRMLHWAAAREKEGEAGSNKPDI
ncbi:small-conductance mechanosensitive channel [Sphingobium fontiphilum]|uniref:Small-conductance mechanosensitive channel n=1 Tax=Sphingobium fontiphilum TaxID=944425 RepID=A0A7W6DK60_9SPHN|nr:mechanosensitive ion channel domain-containing protein [Sphingobium fontiphilum]MBB3982170.1 small-conductance mechanosensitive channel [Sphingobium fontiphilum]